MDELRIFILPFLSPGHMIPLLDFAKLLAARPGVKPTLISTAGNAPFIEKSIANSPIDLLILPFPPSVPQNASLLPNPSDFTQCPDFVRAIEALKDPFDRLVKEHRPDCIVSDMVLPWSGDVAFTHGVPRLVSHGMGAFAATVLEIIHSSGLGDDVDDNAVLVVPRIPHRIEFARSQMFPFPAKTKPNMFDEVERIASYAYGTILNAFAGLEPGYDELYKGRRWLVGPLALSSKEHDGAGYLNTWLDAKELGSVMYVCFGSVTKFTSEQIREIEKGLRDCEHPFIWVVGSNNVEFLTEGVVDEGKGMIVRGWAPQTVILNHPAVGGFMTHCGWNSCLEGATAGVPMVTWPQFADQFCNERLLVDVLRIGVPVGAKVWSTSAEERSFVKGEMVAEAANRVMGRGEEAEGRRKRAKEIGVKAREAMEEGGSSYMDMSKLIDELMDMKKMRSVEGAKGNKNECI